MIQTEEFRSTMPAPLAPGRLNLPEASETTLANGLHLVVVEDNRLPLVSVRLAFRSGDAADPPDLTGLSDMMTHLLTEGTESRTSKQIAEEVERLGATLSAGAGSDVTTVGASVLSIYLPEVLELLADVTLRPSFPQNEVDLAIENTKQLLIQQRAQPSFLAGERVANIIYGDHPYARISPTAESLDGMTREGLAAFHRATLLPNNAVLLVVGDVQRDELFAQLGEFFGNWQPGSIPVSTFPAMPQRSQRKAFIVDRPGSAQSNIVIANPGIERTNPDYFPTLLMHTILGANASSRLFMNLREDKGYTYGAYSNLDARRDAGSFKATAEVRTPVTGDSMKEFFYELERIRTDMVSDQELVDAKAYLTGVFPIRLETQEGLVDQFVNIRMYDLPGDYLHTYRDHVNAVTREQILQVAEKYVTPDRAAVVIVGDAKEITSQVEPFCKDIEFFDTEGHRKGN